MKKKAFYLLWGFIVLALLVFSYIFIQIRLPVLIIIAAAIAILMYFLLKRKLTKEYMDERQAQIEMKCSSITMKISAVTFALANIALAVYAFGVPNMLLPRGPGAPPEHIQTITLGNIAFIELILLVIMFFIYVAFHFYYEHKYGGDIADEE